jgi:protein SCO1/2
VKLDALLAAPRPVLLQFVFTSCTTVCPILSATFSSVQDGLGPGVRLVSISIDPEYDTPARLAAYAARFRARPQWTFLTGSANNIAVVERSFDVETNGKMNHLPVTFLRAAPGQPWVRIEGLTSASELLTEYRHVAR